MPQLYQRTTKQTILAVVERYISKLFQLPVAEPAKARSRLGKFDAVERDMALLGEVLLSCGDLFDEPGEQECRRLLAALRDFAAMLQDPAFESSVDGSGDEVEGSTRGILQKEVAERRGAQCGRLYYLFGNQSFAGLEFIARLLGIVDDDVEAMISCAQEAEAKPPSSAGLVTLPTISHSKTTGETSGNYHHLEDYFHGLINFQFLNMAHGSSSSLSTTRRATANKTFLDELRKIRE